MKGLLLAILGVITSWFVYGLITNDFEGNSPILLILGIVIGYSIGKKDRKKT